MEKTCFNCGKPMRVAATGRPKKFCGQTCRKAASRRARSLPVPDVLVEQRRWVNWKPVRRGDRWTKMPVQPSGVAAASTKSETWSSFAGVDRASKRVGFVLGGNADGKRVVCVDLDHCIGSDGTLSEGAQKVLSLFPDTWVERSPGGDGLHVWGVMDARQHRCVTEVSGQAVEVYSAGRYVTVTRDLWLGSPLVLADLTVGLLGLV